jgi:hypothetical protein
MDEITKIDRKSGAIIWRWGGKHNQFTFANDSIGFSHQHCIRVLPNGHYLLFDNGNFHTPNFSRAVEYVIDAEAMTATEVWEYRHSPDLYTFAMGSVQRLENGNTLIGWGADTSCLVTEVTPEGKTTLEMKMTGTNVSYRVFKFPWQVPQQSVDLEKNGNIALVSYPNPSSTVTQFVYELSEAASPILRITDCLGRVISVVNLGQQSTGSHSYSLDVSHFTKGSYFCAIESNGLLRSTTLVVR